MKNLFIIFSYFSTLLFLVTIAILGYWNVYPYKILEFNKGNGELINKTVKNGEYLPIRQVGCKYKNLTATIDRRFIDTIEYQVPVFKTNRPLGCVDDIELIYIPKALPAGIYHISTIISFDPNPLRNIVYKVDTATFEIIK